MVVFHPDWQSHQKDRNDTIGSLSILVTLKAALYCRRKVSGCGNEQYHIVHSFLLLLLWVFFFLLNVFASWHQINLSHQGRWSVASEVVLVQIRSDEQKLKKKEVVLLTATHTSAPTSPKFNDFIISMTDENAHSIN